MAIAIKAENISKQYRLGYVGSGSLKDDASRWWARMRGKEDPLLTVGETNDRSSKGESDYVWALKDINFEIEQGDTVGIIGRNGAGKSTLLKLLSKVTAPTTGNIKVKGRIASLLEVGTGFHGELTGRENIYLNGAIMGMRKHEITRKLDEIVDFAGVERYLDTPVKRYSSGMYVRLGFAVAAHLENEILIVDEVLAVGDAEFQQKCLGKMGDVAKGEGRTVLFVSNNMSSVAKLCSRGLLLKDGMLLQAGTIDQVINNYNKTVEKAFRYKCEKSFGDENVTINATRIYPENGKDFSTDSNLVVEIRGIVHNPIYGFILGFTLWSQFEYELAYILYDDNISTINIHPSGEFVKKFKIPSNTLASGIYTIQFDVGIHNVKRIINDEFNLVFNITNTNGLGSNFITSGKGKTSLFRPEWIQYD